MKISCAILIAILVCALCAAIVAPVAADGDNPVTTETTFVPVTLEPTTEVTTEPPTTVPTVITIEPTTEPTTFPTFVTEPTTLPTVTAPPTTEPTITIEPTSVGGGKGYIDTYCNVDGASVLFDGKYQCTIAQGVCTVGVSPTGAPIKTVTVSKSGYTSWSGAGPTMPADGQHVSVYATLNPTPTQPTTVPPVQSGTIYAQSSPAGASIYMNGNFYGYSPVTIPNIAPGSYTMKASLSGYTPNTQIVYVYAGQTATYYPTLQPSPPSPHSTGTVRVTSTPTGALVYVDNSYYGKAPLTATLYPGSHTFKLTLSGYADYTANVIVNANTNQNLNAVMTSATYGSVQIQSSPGASVYMDSSLQGQIPAYGTLMLNNVVGGNHLFKVSQKGYNDWLNTVYVKPNSVTTITATLTPSGSGPVPAGTGGIQIVSTPAGAEIYLDNLFKGYTPATMTDITTGQHQILLKYTGYIDYTQTVSVTAGQTTPLAISMQAAPTPTPASPVSPVTIIAGLLAAAGAAALAGRRS